MSIVHSIHLSTNERDDAMAHTQLVFGADGGGTKTLGIVADAAGTLLARLQAGPANPNVVGVDGAANNLVGLIIDCCREAHCSPRDLDAIVLGLAGAGSSAIRERLGVALDEQFRSRGVQAPAVTIESDARIALEGAFDGGPGLIIIAGTGSILLGKTANEPKKVVGGWGRVLGDEGSGYFIGLQALKAVTRDFDGIAPSGSLRALVDARFGWCSREDLIVAVYQQNFAIPSLAPLVLESADENDPVCLEILSRSAALLADQVGVFARVLEAHTRLGVVFVGGLIDHDTVYAKILRETLRSRFPAVDVRPAMHPPVQGAVLLALQIARARP
jgi:N-acetylglucosamine kinase-like BadF-type ATPase